MNASEALRHWVKEREATRIRKESGAPGPWTDDPIIAKFRFCNVRREDDSVTVWGCRQCLADAIDKDLAEVAASFRTKLAEIFKPLRRKPRCVHDPVLDGASGIHVCSKCGRGVNVLRPV